MQISNHLCQLGADWRFAFRCFKCDNTQNKQARVPSTREALKETKYGSYVFAGLPKVILVVHCSHPNCWPAALLCAPMAQVSRWSALALLETCLLYKHFQLSWIRFIFAFLLFLNTRHDGKIFTLCKFSPKPINEWSLWDSLGSQAWILFAPYLSSPFSSFAQTEGPPIWAWSHLMTLHVKGKKEIFSLLKLLVGDQALDFYLWIEAIIMVKDAIQIAI